ncbi:hypothetical protein PIB30_023378 [Stylosanthes scabra]|uniref:Uncharacterized protein n=1 Tax=Stylosanthes scabra TaxID=79078 RepID=A0ABU6V9P5_9FABA|nr:hypothetical protein [Stylosanthes scabra]
MKFPQSEGACSRRRRNTLILFHVNGDSGVSSSDFDDNEGALVHHLVWFIRTVGLHQSVIDMVRDCEAGLEYVVVEVVLG